MLLHLYDPPGMEFFYCFDGKVTPHLLFAAVNVNHLSLQIKVDWLPALRPEIRSHTRSSKLPLTWVVSSSNLAQQ